MFKSILQTPYWAKFKEQSGWSFQKISSLYGLSRTVALGKSILYFPEICLDKHFLEAFDEVKSTPVKSRIFSRFEFLELWTAERAGELVKLGLIKAFEDIQPEYRQWINVEPSEDHILEQMKSKGRYNLNLAKKHNLKVELGINDKSIETLYELYRQTAVRADFQGRDRQYFKNLATMLKENDAGEIIIVSKGDQQLAALLLTFYDGVCSYLYGGSGGDRSLMAPYLGHWEAIKLAKARDCRLYDLLAVAPPDDEKHPHVGLSRFKAQFGGETVRLLGSWDLVNSRFWYGLYRIAQKRRRKAIR